MNMRLKMYQVLLFKFGRHLCKGSISHFLDLHSNKSYKTIGKQLENIFITVINLINSITLREDSKTRMVTFAFFSFFFLLAFSFINECILKKHLSD